MRGEIEAGAAGIAVVPHQRLRHRGQLPEDLIVEIGKADLAAGAEDAVLDDETIELSLSRLRQRIPGRPEIRKLGFAAGGRELAGREQRALRWDLLERAVGVPELVAEVEQVATVIPRKDTPLGVEVRDVRDVRAQPHLRAGVIRIDLERTKEPAESELLFVGHGLARKHKNAVTAEGRVDLGEDPRGHRTGDLDPAHFGPESRVKRAELDRHRAAPERRVTVI